MSQITITGLVATTPRHLVTQEGLHITSFRVASSDPTDENGSTNWFTITAFNALGINSASSISKGDRIIVTGSLRVRDWDNGTRAGTSIEIQASTLGHDLVYGTSVFTRELIVSTPVVETPAEPAPHSCSCGSCGL
jgi:single-strand DNA-binding protein